MNNDQFKKGIEDLRKIKMSDSEKSLLWHKLDIYSGKKNTHTHVVSPWYRLEFSSFVLRTGTLLASVFVLFVSGLGTFLTAENSLPGDKLYSLKTDLIEPLKYSFATNAIQKANFETKKIDSRLREAETLEVLGMLSDPVQEDLEKRIKSHVDSFNGLVSKESNDQSSVEVSDARINFEANANAHSKVLDEIGEISKNNNSERTQKLKAALEGTRDDASDQSVQSVSARMATFSQVAAPAELKLPSEGLTVLKDKEFSKKRKEIEKMIREIKEKIEKSDNRINQRILEDLSLSLNQAELYLDEAVKENNSGNKSVATSNLLESIKIAKEVKTRLSITKELRIKIFED